MAKAYVGNLEISSDDVCDRRVKLDVQLYSNESLPFADMFKFLYLYNLKIALYDYECILYFYLERARFWLSEYNKVMGHE